MATQDRRGATWLGEAWPGGAWFGKAGKARHGLTDWQGWAWRGQARQERQGPNWMARLGEARQERQGADWVERLGEARQATSQNQEGDEEMTIGTKGQVVISAPNFETAAFLIRGTHPYVQNKFSHKALEIIRGTQEAGSTANKNRKKAAKDFDEQYEGAKHVAKDGWCGIPATAFRNAMISACRVAGFKMTHAKLSVFVEADGFDGKDGTPLVRITKGAPARKDLPVRLPNGTVDIRPRPMWEPGWEAQVRVRFDADQFTVIDVSNLMMRVGMQVGVGEGRPDSANSAGMLWGMFELVPPDKKRRKSA